MGRKIDLDSENVSSNLSSHRTHPLSYDNYVPSEEDIEEENYDNEEVEEETEEEEVAGEEVVDNSNEKPLTDNSDTVNKTVLHFLSFLVRFDYLIRLPKD